MSTRFSVKRFEQTAREHAVKQGERTIERLVRLQGKAHPSVAPERVDDGQKTISFSIMEILQRGHQSRAA